MPKQKDDFDIQIANRVRAQRMARGMSQEALGNALGVTFQQVQKYEKGVNRVSAGRLMKIAKALDVPVYALMGDDHAAKRAAGGEDVFEYLVQPGAVQLLRAYGQIPSRDLKKIVVDLCDVLARENKPAGR